MMEYKPLTAEYDAALAALIRRSLEARDLAVPGTVYFDEGLDHLSEYYNHPERPREDQPEQAGEDRQTRAYYVLLDDGELIGGIGLAKFDGIPDCCELQKLYLDDARQGAGIGYDMIRFIEERARKQGFQRMYLETHTNLQAAIHEYEKAGYVEIDRPDCVVHSTMNRFYLKEI